MKNPMKPPRLPKLNQERVSVAGIPDKHLSSFQQHGHLKLEGLALSDAASPRALQNPRDRVNDPAADRRNLAKGRAKKALKKQLGLKPPTVLPDPEDAK